MRLTAREWEGRRSGSEWKGPCPKCGGTDRFHVAPGRKQPVLAYCRHGCPYSELKREVFGDRLRDRSRSVPGPCTPRRAPVPAVPGAAEPSVREEEDAGGATMRGPCRARTWWRDSQPVPVDPNHPARRWAAHRNLWPPRERFPDMLRWVGRTDGPGSLVAGLWRLPEWAAGPCKAPRAVQLIHVDAHGRPREDKLAGPTSATTGPQGGRVFVVGELLAVAGIVHVAEGIADALAIAAHCEGAAIAAGSTANTPKLAPDLGRLRKPVAIWPDGDPAGRKAASELMRRLRESDVVVREMPTPDGEDPASWIPGVVAKRRPT